MSDCLLATRGVTIEDMEAIWKEVGKSCSCDHSSQTSSRKQDVLISAHSQSRALKQGWMWTFDDGTVRAQVKKADEKVIVEDTFSHGQTLKRHEFLQVLVHVALVRYMRVERVADFSDAVDEMLRSGIVANVPAEALQNSNIFRQKHCYTEAIEHVLRRHTDWLRVRALIFPAPALLGPIFHHSLSGPLLSLCNDRHQGYHFSSEGQGHVHRRVDRAACASQLRQA